MFGPRKTIACLAIAAALALAATPVSGFSSSLSSPAESMADDGNCGSVRLVLKNPDLQEAADGFIRASGWFFIQFQAVGPGAERVKTFTFSFGKPLPDGTARCDTPRWITGAYIPDYRGDYTPEDGFFVPINTTLVSDGDYGAAVHAYDSSGVEIGRYYAKAKVENGCGQMRCSDRTIQQIVERDKILPWPRVLPGDGIQTNKDVNGLTIEFAESVKQVQAFINGNETALTPWAGVPMDDDAIPGNDNQACGSIPSQVCTKRVWGPAFKWEGPVLRNDVIRVVATDYNNNRVEKIIHLLDPTQGGIVSGDVVNVDITVDNSTKVVGPGQQGEFIFTFVSVSSAEAHINLPLAYDTTQLEARFTPDHVVVKPGARTTASLIITPKQDVSSGTFLLVATPTWRSSGQDVSKEFPLSFIVGSGQGGNLVAPSPTDNGTAQSGTDGGGTPGLGAVASAGILVAAVIVVARRRRQDGP